jgi:hypothetical protein
MTIIMLQRSRKKKPRTLRALTVEGVVSDDEQPRRRKSALVLLGDLKRTRVEISFREQGRCEN